jgi:hypothetical protein
VASWARAVGGCTNGERLHSKSVCVCCVLRAACCVMCAVLCVRCVMSVSDHTVWQTGISIIESVPRWFSRSDSSRPPDRVGHERLLSAEPTVTITLDRRQKDSRVSQAPRRAPPFGCRPRLQRTSSSSRQLRNCTAPFGAVQSAVAGACMVLAAGLCGRWSARRGCSVAGGLVRARPAARLLPAVTPRRYVGDGTSPNPRVYLDIAIGAAEPQRITFEVRAASCSRTSPLQNALLSLCSPGPLAHQDIRAHLLRSCSHRRCPRLQVRAAS